MSKVNPGQPAPQKQSPEPKRRLWVITAVLLAAALICFVVLYAVEKAKGDDDDDDGTCGEEDKAMEDCMMQSITDAQYFKCFGCISYGMADIMEISFPSCPVIQAMLCETLSTCPCGPCAYEMQESLNCELEADDVPCLIDCDFSSPVTPAPSPNPTSPPPDNNSTTPLTAIVHLSAFYLSRNGKYLF